MMIYLLTNVQQSAGELEKKYPVGAPVSYQLLASFLFALNTLLVKILINVSSAQILIYRSIITMVVNGTLMRYTDNLCYPPIKKTYSKLIMRGIAGGIGVCSLFQGLKLLPISEGIVLVKTNPLWVALIVTFVLKKEKFRCRLLIDVLLCLFGIALIARPPFIIQALGYLGYIAQIESKEEWTYHTLGVILCLTAAFMTTGVQILISSLSGEINQFAILQYFSLISLIVATLQLVLIPYQEFVIPYIDEFILMIFLGFIGCFGQWFMNRSFIIGDLTLISSIGQSQVIFTFLFDIFILKQELQLISLVGIALVIGCLISSLNHKRQVEVFSPTKQ